MTSKIARPGRSCRVSLFFTPTGKSKDENGLTIGHRDMFETAITRVRQSWRRLRDDLDKTMVALGDGVKRIYQSEVAPISKMRRVQTRHGLQVTGDQTWASR